MEMSDEDKEIYEVQILIHELTVTNNIKPHIALDAMINIFSNILARMPEPHYSKMQMRFFQAQQVALEQVKQEKKASE